MNCPSRQDTEPTTQDGWNQNPSALAAELTTREDLNGRANSREMGNLSTEEIDSRDMDGRQRANDVDVGDGGGKGGSEKNSGIAVVAQKERGTPSPLRQREERSASRRGGAAGAFARRTWGVLVKYAKFMGPGFMVAVAYIDPGNYATDVAAGASYRFKLLFIVLMSNLFAIVLQALCIRLGSVTGMNLAENCKAHLPPWMNYILYFFAESAIIATDIAEVIGTAIALNLLLHIPLVAGCAISILDVLIILFFYHPSGSIRALRAFEIFVMALVLGVVICFCFQLSLIKNTSVGEVFKGYLPSSAVVEGRGLFQSCGILGATVMPHSLFLGSGIVQARLKDFDVKSGNPEASNVTADDASDPDSEHTKYRPSLAAIKSCMSYSIAELAVSLFTFALFVNSAILIVAGSSLYNTPDANNADLFGIHDLLSKALAPVAGTIFALALLLSGTSAGIVCTIAGQMVSEGMLNWSCKPWLRRLVTRSISITPSIIIAGAVGGEGLSKALEGSQVALSVILPVVSAPLIWFTCRARYMSVTVGEADERIDGAVDAAPDAVLAGGADAGAAAQEEGRRMHTTMCMKNGIITSTLSIAIWGIIVVMNVALIVLVAMGQD